MFELFGYREVCRQRTDHSNIKDIPDSYGGDFGSECYSFSGHALQCYLHEQTSDKEKLTKAQKQKIRKDIRKITVTNVNQFTKLFEDNKNL